MMRAARPFAVTFAISDLENVRCDHLAQFANGDPDLVTER